MTDKDKSVEKNVEHLYAITSGSTNTGFTTAAFANLGVSPPSRMLAMVSLPVLAVVVLHISNLKADASKRVVLDVDACGNSVRTNISVSKVLENDRQHEFASVSSAWYAVRSACSSGYYAW